MTELTLTERYLRRISRLLSSLVVLLVLVVAYCAYDAIPRLTWSLRTNSNAYRKANELLSSKDYQAVVDLCSKRLEKDGADPWMYWYIGEAQYRMENWSESAAAMRRALELKPDFKERIQPYLDVAEEKMKN